MVLPGLHSWGSFQSVALGPVRALLGMWAQLRAWAGLSQPWGFPGMGGILCDPCCSPGWEGLWSIKSSNPTGVWVGRDPRAPPVPPLPWQGHLPLSQCPAWPWALPGIQGQPQLLWAPCARACPPCQGTIPAPNPIQPCPLALGAIPWLLALQPLSPVPLQLSWSPFGPWWGSGVPLEPPFLQAEPLSQLPQPLLGLQPLPSSVPCPGHAPAPPGLSRQEGPRAVPSTGGAPAVPAQGTGTALALLPPQSWHSPGPVASWPAGLWEGRNSCSGLCWSQCHSQQGGRGCVPPVPAWGHSTCLASLLSAAEWLKNQTRTPPTLVKRWICLHSWLGWESCPLPRGNCTIDFHLLPHRPRPSTTRVLFWEKKTSAQLGILLEPILS
ncbi:MAPK-interacting and spindle-stabilizing protein-like [Poecile atricapillus]|uniref:MAPK-interacting and spindle-stabilizing protein-like n=1 Tax=Poecile atricapillus TaxID=48891 RepID=UPI0027392E9A|nr:MAPK-interacting and spindle-stabilizing protein-like [Poecile atricapillus]